MPGSELFSFRIVPALDLYHHPQYGTALDDCNHMPGSIPLLNFEIVLVNLNRVRNSHVVGMFAS